VTTLIRIPSKTFLAGEYLALCGGPSLVLNTPPVFELYCQVTDDTRLEGIHPESPAGRFWADHQSSFANLTLQFMDPHQGRGGFGASTAQFAMLYQLHCLAVTSLQPTSTDAAPSGVMPAQAGIQFTETFPSVSAQTNINTPSTSPGAAPSGVMPAQAGIQFTETFPSVSAQTNINTPSTSPGAAPSGVMPAQAGIQFTETVPAVIAQARTGNPSNSAYTYAKAILSTYHHYATLPNQIPPSGADLIGQLTGGICYFNPNAQQLTSLSWSIPNLTFLLFRTQQKLATHEHLGQIQLPTDRAQAAMADTVEQLKQGLVNQDTNAIIHGVTRYRQLLSAQALTHPHTEALLTALDGLPGVNAAKGCGALGADVILVVADKEQRATIIDAAQHLGLTWVTDSVIMPANEDPTA
jgi:mevalonate kinase